MIKNKIVEKGIIAGNLEPKYITRNPISAYLVDQFLTSVEKLVGQTKASNIHEVGCGEGFLTMRLAQKFPHVSFRGSDFSEQIINIANENLKKQSNNLSISFEAKSIYDLNYKQDTASLIICCEVLEHLEFPEKALDVLSKITQDYIILSVPREPLWRILNMARGKYLMNLGNTPGHIQHWSKFSFLNLIDQYFDIVEIITPIPWIITLCKIKK